jgi:glycosyltransferase involved in cell wall biosynthesis
MKIVHIVDSMAGGGTQEFLLNYLKLSGLREAEVYLVQLNGDNMYSSEIRNLGCHHITLNGHHNSLLGKLNPLTFLKIYGMLKSIKPDILHARLYLALIYGVLPAKLLRMKNILYTIEGSFTQAGKLYKWSLKIISRWIDIIFTSYRHEFQETGLPERKYREYKVCLDFGTFHSAPFPSPFRATSRKGPNLGSVGRLHPHKGHQYAIQALRVLKQNYPQITLYIAGSGPYEGNLRELIDRYDLQDQVVFCGFVKDIRGFWSKMDVCLQCSINETLNLSSLWAMSCGVPVIKFRIPGMRDQADLHHLQVGLMANYLSAQDLGIKVAELLRNEKRAAELSRNAIEYINDNYSALESTAYYDRIYRDLAAGRTDRCAA